MTTRREISENPPVLDEHHVRLPDQLATLLGAAEAHARGVTGKGVRVAVIDSGFFPHPFYESRGYKIERVPTTKEKEPHVDEYGHGTAQLASLLSLAPEAQILAIKCMDRDPAEALAAALEQKPHIISCAWGFNIDHPGTTSIPSQYRRTARLITKAVDLGITVVAAAGNGQNAFPASMPQVIAAGGAFYGPDGVFAPSDLSSAFESSLYPGRHVPDICGLIGNRPHGRLLLVPVPPAAKLARRIAFSAIAAGDSSERKRGWAMFSGTSAATAMISGACALILQAVPGLKPSLVKQMLIEGSRVLTDGSISCRLLDADSALRALDGLV